MYCIGELIAPVVRLNDWTVRKEDEQNQNGYIQYQGRDVDDLLTAHVLWQIKSVLGQNQLT